MFASELMEEVRENPDKYEKQVFEVTDGYALTSTGKSVPHIIISAGTAREGHTGKIAYFSTDTQVKEIKQPVTWQEALEAHAHGKAIKLVIHTGFKGDVVHIFNSDILMLKSQNGYILTSDVLLTGIWYIED